MNPLRIPLLLAALVLLSGCGFHLRGGAVLPENVSRVYLSGGNQVLRDELTVFLEDAGAQVVSNREQADAVIAVNDEGYDRRVLSVDPRTGKSREFELAYSMSYSVSRSDGSPLLAPQRVQLTRDYVFDPDAVIGKSREEDVLRREMRRDAVQQMLRQMNAALGK